MKNSTLRIGLLSPAVTGYNALDSGIGQHFADLAAGLVQRGHAVFAITPTANAKLPPAPALEGVTFVPFDPRMPRWLNRLSGLNWQLHSVVGLRHRVQAATLALAAAAQREKIDVIETTSTGALGLRYLNLSSRAPVATRVSTTAAQLVSHNRGQAQWPYRVEQTWEERLVRASDRLITHTVHHRDELCRHWNLPVDSFTIIPHGIGLPSRAELLANPPDSLDVLYVGRFEHRKGIDVLLEILPELVTSDARVRFILVGQDTGGYWQKKFWSENPTLDRRRVVFAGLVSAENLRDLYRSCSLLVAPSRYESFGLIYVEAMAWGKPVIGCRAGGIPEVIDDGKTGLLAEPGDPTSLRAALWRLIRASDLRKEMGVAARRSTETNFSRETLAARSEEFYRRMLIRKSS